MRPFALPFTLAVLLAACSSHAQYNLAWAKQFNGTLNTVDWFSEMVVDSVGNTYVAGTTNVDMPQMFADIVLVKYSPTGAKLWSRTYDGPGHNQDTCFDLCMGKDGYVYVVGRVNTPTTSSDFVTLKYHPSTGALVWSRTYDGPSSSIDQAMAVAADVNGNVAVTGEVWSDHIPYSNGDYCTLMYGPAGNLLWSKLYNGPANFIAVSDQPKSVAIDHAGDVVVSGDSPFSDNADDIFTIKYRGADGSEVWTARYSGFPSSENEVSLAIASNNDVIVGGNTQTNGLHVTIFRYDSATGQTVWMVDDAFPHGGRLSNRACLATDANDNVAISVTYDPDTDNSNLNYNIQTTKYRGSDGSRIWSVSYGNTNRLDGQSADAVTMDGLGNVIVAGSDLFAPNNVVSIWKFGALDGHLVWKGTYNGPRQPDRTTRVRVTTFGDIIAAGITGVDVGTGDSDLQVVKFTTKARPPITPH